MRQAAASFGRAVIVTLPLISALALSAIATGARMLELRGAAGSGGNSTSTGATIAPRGRSQSMVFRLTKNETVTTAIASRISLRLTAGRIVSPDRFNPGVYRADI